MSTFHRCDRCKLEIETIPKNSSLRKTTLVDSDHENAAIECLSDRSSKFPDSTIDGIAGKGYFDDPTGTGRLQIIGISTDERNSGPGKRDFCRQCIADIVMGTAQVTRTTFKSQIQHEE